MDVHALDRSATTGTTVLHRTAPAAKLVAAALVLGAVVSGTDPLVVAAIALGLVAIAAAVRLPLRAMLPLALYPSLFALVFAFAAAPGPVTGALFVVKAVTAALAVVTLMFTTPYPQVFAAIQKITPELVGDALLMTYRSLFILGEKSADLVRAVRLRSGISHRQPVRAAQATARALGGLLLYTFDLAQREYDILRLRGYEGGLRVSRPTGGSRSGASGSLAFGALALALALAFRFASDLAGYGWLVAAVSLIALAAAIVRGRRNR